jgi:FkbM family methyltransferase
MGFLSYAQNFEDVMLWRALGHIPNGVYVDVGAQHPRIDSISRAFYEHGWRGIHVEPVPAFADMLRKDRPDEIVLQVALGATEGTLELNIFADTGLSTVVSSYAERHQAERGYEVQRMHVPVLTLKSALSSLVEKDVHWLKIDVEGFEEQVLRGWDSTQLRPWVLVVEATIPNSPETDYAGWEPLVLAAGYRFVYFDGLNRYYIADEHPELAAAFAVPPNIFDAVELSGLASWGLCNVAVDRERALTDQARALLHEAENELQVLRGLSEGRQAELTQAAARIAELERRVEQGVLAQARVGELEAAYSIVRAERDAADVRLVEQKDKAHQWWRTAEDLRDELARVYRSRSWRASAPLRHSGVLARRARNFARRVLNWARRKQAGQAAGGSAPEAAKRDGVVVTRAGGTAVPRRLSRSAARLYQDLKNAVDEGKK